MNEVINCLISRRSVKKYTGEPIPQDMLEMILEAGKYAANGRGLQAPVMVAVQKPETVKMLSQMNAGILGTDTDPFYNASTVIVVLADTAVNTWLEDGSLVMGNLMNAAHSLGIDSCWIHRAREMFESKEGLALLKKWGLPDTYKGVGNCILGYREGEYPLPKPRRDHRVIYD